MLLFAVQTINQTQEMVGSLSYIDPSLTQNVNNNMLVLASLMIVSYFGFVILSYIYSLVFTHRVSGPIVAICDVIEQMKNGNYSVARNLRGSDELHAIMDKLRELGDTLEKKSKA